MGLELTQNALEQRLNEILTRAKSTQGASARVYPVYQALQTQRFMTENASEGQQWDPLKGEYAKYKVKKYSSSPGGGRKMLIATGHLAGAVIGPGAPFPGTESHRAIFKPWSMQISVSLNYAQYVAARRPFMSFSDASMQKMKAALSQYLVGDIVGRSVAA